MKRYILHIVCLFLIGIIVVASLYCGWNIPEAFDNTLSDENKESSATTNDTNDNESTIDTNDELETLKQHSTDDKTSQDIQQNKHIEELREVLSNTIHKLRQDDLLPPGTSCGCASKPMVDPTTGMASVIDGCRPPGWMRMMERENRRTQQHESCVYHN